MSTKLILLAASWLAYFFLHSLLASLAVKRWAAQHFPRMFPGYRLFFNTMAVLLVLPPLGLALAFRGNPLWRWSGPWLWVALGIQAAAVLGFLWSLRWYDGSEFLGLRQWRGRVTRIEDQEHMHISPLHRYVRHPWYSLGLLLVWTRDMDPAFLTSAVLITLYFVVGSRLEERKLLVYHGEAYRAYRARVPALVPLPWRHLSAGEARRLVAEAGESEQTAVRWTARPSAPGSRSVSRLSKR
jgi:protein-S-isoprenylcysteine O-methyltransferase Ste14